MTDAQRFALRESLGIATVAGVLFGMSGDLGWWNAWAMVALTTGWVLGTAFVVIYVHPGLLKERLRPGAGAASWDTKLMTAYGLLQIAMLVVSGLDHRLGWTAPFPGWVIALGLLLTTAGHGLVVWSTAANAFFSQIVRIQFDRDHAVVRTGPYAWVRHPGYVGTILTSLATSLALGSLPGYFVGVAAAAVMVLRTKWEDEKLRKELGGYEDYVAQVRYRLIPRLW